MTDGGYTHEQIMRMHGLNPGGSKAPRHGAKFLNSLVGGGSSVWAPRRQRNAARWAQHRAKMGKKDSLRFGSYLYRPHPAHFKKPPKSPGANENARGERIWAEAQAVARLLVANNHVYDAEMERRVLSKVAGMAVKL